MAGFNSALYQGTLGHHRYQPFPHGFHYSLFMVYLDLAELPRLFDRSWLWSARGFNVAWWRRQDYFDKNSNPLSEAIHNWVAQQTGEPSTGPIRMLTNLRYWGLSFNPVTFYYVFTPQEKLQWLIADVTNTPWGERHRYLIPVEGELNSKNRWHYQHQKAFHVSPFMPMTMDYHWQFNQPADSLYVQIATRYQDTAAFNATLMLTRRPMNRANQRYMLWQHPWVTAKVVGGIYWQALKLWLKKAPFYDHPHR